MSKFLSTSLCLALLSVSVAAQASGQVIANDPAKCRSGPSTIVQINGIKAGTGMVRVQSYRATQQDWLAKGRWINRIEVPARAGSMTVCVPLPDAGSYAIAVRHDVTGNGKTDLRSDGGGMSNNPSINVFNLGKPNVRRTAFEVGNGPKTISIAMRYM
ncbi:DUF2141 domain-containing protein [Sphingopyxis solisilvae]|uniref:DUF2141 domain-containing protein n=1 Tax=Sphingopyxis solisilvae TaxID=1886788 RepID=UPI001892AF0A|nr:DUF2141 domain-containing protein [Sphingopyxis solisilvae]